MPSVSTNSMMSETDYFQILRRNIFARREKEVVFVDAIIQSLHTFYACQIIANFSELVKSNLYSEAQIAR
jgi:hypothetical protein